MTQRVVNTEPLVLVHEGCRSRLHLSTHVTIAGRSCSPAGVVTQEVFVGQSATTGRKKELGRSLSGGLLSEAGGRTYNNEKRK